MKRGACHDPSTPLLSLFANISKKEDLRRKKLLQILKPVLPAYSGCYILFGCSYISPEYESLSALLTTNQYFLPAVQGRGKQVDVSSFGKFHALAKFRHR